MIVISVFKRLFGVFFSSPCTGGSMRYLVLERVDGETSITLHNERTLKEYVAGKGSDWKFRTEEGTDNGFPKDSVDYAVDLAEKPIAKRTSVIIKVTGNIETPVNVGSSHRLASDLRIRLAGPADIGKKAHFGDYYGDATAVAKALANGGGTELVGVTTDGRYVARGNGSVYTAAYVLA